MSIPTLQASILDIFERMGRDVPSCETDVFETGTLDSIAFIELLAALEETFGLVFQPDDLEVDNFRSVNAIARFIGGSGGAVDRRPAESA